MALLHNSSTAYSSYYYSTHIFSRRISHLETRRLACRGEASTPEPARLDSLDASHLFCDWSQGMALHSSFATDNAHILYRIALVSRSSASRKGSFGSIEALGLPNTTSSSSNTLYNVYSRTSSNCCHGLLKIDTRGRVSKPGRPHALSLDTLDVIPPSSSSRRWTGVGTRM